MLQSILVLDFETKNTESLDEESEGLIVRFQHDFNVGRKVEK